MTNRNGVAHFDFTTVSGCDQLVVGPTHSSRETLDLLITDVPHLVRVAVVALIGNSDHFTLSSVISIAQAVPNLYPGRLLMFQDNFSRKVILKHQVNCNTV